MIDSLRHKGLRKRLLRIVESKGIDDQKILDAMYNVPRHFFLPQGFDERAYEDNAFPIAAEQTISQPYTVAYQTRLLNVKADDKILEIGTGSGYQTCVLLELGAKVYTIERQKVLFDETSAFIRKLGYSANCYYGDGYKGLPGYSPFDKILITCGAPYIPEALLVQLRIGGILVAPVGESDSQTMIRITRISENDYQKEDFGKFVFVPFLKGKS